MANLVANIGSDMGWYKWYEGQATRGELPDRYEAMLEESNQINLIIQESANSIDLTEELLRDFKIYIINLIKKENLLLKQLNIPLSNISFNMSIEEIIEIEREKGIALTNKLKDATRDGTSKSQLYEYLRSSAFIDKITKKSATMSFALLNNKKNTGGKSKVEKILKKVMNKKNKNGAEDLLDFLMGQNDEDMTQAEVECIELLIDIINEEIKNAYSTLMVEKGTRLTRSERKIKDWFKQIGKRLSQSASSRLSENDGLISEAMNNLIHGNFIPVNSTFALQLNDSINDEQGMYQEYLHSTFYTEEEKKRINISSIELAENLYQLIQDSLGTDSNDKILKEWLLREENKNYFINVLTQAWESQDLRNFEGYNKSNIASVCEKVAATLLLSNLSSELNIQLNKAKNKLSQSTTNNICLSLFEEDYKIKISRNSSAGKTISLYDNVTFDLLANKANNYISSDLLRCIRFLLVNSSILSSPMNIEIDEEAIEKVLLFEISNFLEIKNYSNEEDLNSDSFFMINGQVLSFAYILSQAYKKAEAIFNAGIDQHLFQITKNISTDYVDDDAKITITTPLKYDPFMEYEQGTSILVENIWYPKMIRESNKNLACNIIIHFKGIKISI